ncbi:universal stress protein [Bacillus solimangrovi]|uniref:UspA domain-containing protein n=1 Tax=Bacillus solimangrovi TaxID=1305675 RepID=A0A1E5LFH6_9BACI|nr:universal stress protein [Bacillus solimangrovi]OEH92822.1 hypothetical protein BFG57_02170 [Bacillus solimangrovi]
MNYIVIPIDGSEYAIKAIDYATTIATNADTTLVLLNVQSTPEDVNQLEGTAKAQMEEACILEGKQILQRAANYADKINVKYELAVRVGLASIEINQEAKKKNATCIIMGSRGMGPDVSKALGSVSHGVLHLATCPVTFVPASML